MSPNLLYLLLGVFFAGIVILALALRGRRINDHPICRDCGFDLDGVYPEGSTCPECGAGLKRDRAVRQGARQKVWSAAALGALMVLTPIVPLGAVGVAAITGRDLDTLKPLWLLLWEARHADKIRTGKVATEVLSRARSRSLSANDYQAAIDAALAIQADPSRAWSETWGDLIEQAKFDSVLTATQEEAFNQHMAIFTVAGRQRINAGSALALTIKLTETRTASTTAIDVPLLAADPTIDGKPLMRIVTAKPKDNPFNDPAMDLFNMRARLADVVPDAASALGTISLKGSNARTIAFGISPFSSGSGGGAFGLTLRVPDDLSSGEHTLVLPLEVGSPLFGGAMRTVKIVNGKVMGGLASGEGNKPLATLKLPLTVLPVDTPAVKAVTDAGGVNVAATMEAALAPREVSVGIDPFSAGFTSRGMGLKATAIFNLKDIKVPLAFDVVMKVGDQEVSLGTLTTGKIPEQPGNAGTSFFSSSSTMTITINGQTVTSSSSSNDAKDPDKKVLSAAINAPPAPGATCDIILRPSKGLAEETLDLTEYYGQTITLKDVPIKSDGLENMMPAMPRRLRVPR